MIPVQDALVIFSAAIFGSSVNAVAGGGGFVSYPSLISAGAGPLAANAISTVALWPGNMASFRAYRTDADYSWKQTGPLIMAITLGGLIGSLLAVKSSPALFSRFVPFFLLFTWLVFVCSPVIIRRFLAGPQQHTGIAGKTVILLLTGIYGGFFGAGLGMLLLTIFSFLGYRQLNEMNGLKVLLVSWNNGIAAITFIASRMIIWEHTLIMLTGALLGGYYGARLARKIPQAVLRKIIVVLGAVITLLFFLKEYYPH
ncbi:sulfite exporter TauE/SafE family protein [Chitinophaga solisilvae]|uniref:Probable membrane transporter protein n=1 Tax=Chitinophaga solisilvae TaxID=1233460 RepID=A0A9Q5DA89_9BACT|nr:sulfite exporter TauE/SafE family protein [Chitinophaga solisilvae]NSL91014.1 sulfite exporter TauE/SafE family protein [Chitinophaga solisilvae]